jgi:hypothetical protein
VQPRVGPDYGGPVLRLSLSAGTHGERHAVTSQVLDALGRVGVIEDARQHSNKQIAIRFEVSAGGVPALRASLADLPLRLSDASTAELAAAADGEAVAGWLVVTFVHGEPDLRVTAPAVPG